MPAHLSPELRRLAADCSACHDACTAAVEHCLRRGEDARLIGTLLDCAQACGIARDFALRGSPLGPGYSRGCAHACGSAASACEKIDDDVMTACARACRRAVESCRATGGPDRHQHR